MIRSNDPHHLARCLCLAAGLGLVPLGAQAESNVVIEPGVKTRATFTDNVNTSAKGDSDFIMEVTPSIRLSRRAGRLTGSFDGSLRNVLYTNQNDRSTSFISFRGNGEFEAVKDLLFIEAVGSVSRNDRSAFGSRSSSDPLNTNANNETRYFSLAPRLQFRLGPSAQGTLRYQAAWNNGSSITNSRQTDTWTLNLKDAEAYGPLGWYVNYSHNTTQYDGSPRDLTDELGRAGVSYRLTRQVVLRASVGRESNDFSLSGRQSKTTYGYGFDWIPGPRTSLSATTEQRLFGRSYDLAFSHRSKRSALQLSYTRDYSSSDQLIRTSIDDYFYQLIYDSLGTISDPLQREAAARYLVDQLGLAGVSVQSAFVSNTQTLRRNLRADLSFTGVRNTVTVSVFRTEAERISPDLIVSGRDDFASYNLIRTRGLSLALSHRLSQLASANAMLGQTQTKGEGLISRNQRRTTFSLGVSRQLGARSNGSLTYRHQRQTGDTAFTENAITATLGLRF
ncbi:TIGR03016 family PEP-CTERM system-associated outer membrane protein [Nitrogeniibacter mangrovi]|uniref:TIGR03016 family PEP-CTERM system-associated outer membrane protein n=1 Tax=Nitrogeniibacter mangrovi TaxID=2016596 RepID=A0A6C1B679_9RHOO|nr:TIGR03016 family PEP-CTERM system-associated outer membrane protein [Nitrogeniibacter mangrovi]QID18549.1 TIGR03016 family PEP-CTERM system-associated outer membrane protein [Nitrogeniibacter mangrovi]